MRPLTHWRPFRALRRRDDAFDDLFRKLFERWDSDVMAPAVEVAEADGEITVKMAVPGVEKNQLEISIHDDRLSVRGEVKQEHEEEQKSFYRQEIRYGAFQREVALPSAVDAEAAKADLKDGILTVRLPKSPQQKARTIDVSMG